MVLRHILSYLIAAFTVALCADTCRAGFIFLGPTPYLSAADSPFGSYLGQPDFYLEDFEDGELNTPGIFQRDIFPPDFGGSFLGTVVAPSNTTDSVDSDDGVIDGLGREGHSFRSGAHFTIDTFPPSQQFHSIFEFDGLALNAFPNVFGFVWTDGHSNSSLSFSATTTSGAQLQSSGYHSLGDPDRDGGTMEDRFFGVVADEGIVSVAILGGYVGNSEGFDYFEIDHVQYGIVIAEPSTVALALIVVSAIVTMTGFKIRRI